MENLETLKSGFFNFEYPEFLLLNFLIFIFLYLELIIGRKSTTAISKLKTFIDEHLLKHLVGSQETKKASIYRILSLCLIIIFTSIALANPRWNYTEIQSYRSSLNVVFALDISRSMLSEDEKPNRIARAKQEITDIMISIKDVNYGLIAFAEQAHVVSPITTDKQGVEVFLPSISPNLASVQGSNIEAAISSAKLLFDVEKNALNYLIILSDGGFDVTSKAQEIIDKKNFEIISLGFGTKEGAPIPKKNGGFIKYANKTIISKINDSNLKKISGKSNYVKASYLDEDLKRITSKLDLQRKFEASKYSNLRIWHDRFYIFIALILATMLPFFAKGVKLPLIIFMLVFPINTYAAEEDVKFLEKLKLENIEYNYFKNKDEQALEDYQNKKYDQAEAKFESSFNKGVAAYRNSNLAKAEEYFSAKQTPVYLYNKGNSQLKQLKAEAAIKTYKKLLEKTPENKKAKQNLKIAEELLKKQKRDKENQNNKKDGQDSKDNKNDQQQNKDDKNKGKNNSKQQKNQQKQDRDEENKDSSSNNNIDELERNAERIFNKVESKPEKLLKSRFKNKEKALKKNKKINYKPW